MSASMSGGLASRTASLSDVPEVEETYAGGGGTPPYFGSPTPSTSSFHVPPMQTSRSSSSLATGAISRKPSSVRTLGKASSSSVDSATPNSATANPPISALKRKPSTSSQARSVHSPQPPHSPKPMSTTHTLQKYRSNPRLPNDKECALAPSTMMYWSRAPVFGAIPMRTMRAHTATIVDNVAWLFGGTDEKDCWNDIYLFDTETMQWSHPDTTGETPPPCRAHTATLVDRKLYVFGGGQGPTLYNTTYILDVTTRRWSKLPLPKSRTTRSEANEKEENSGKVSKPTSHEGGSEDLESRVPAPRRAHTAVFYAGRIWVFGGGNGMTALNDVWTLDISSATTRSGADAGDGGSQASNKAGGNTLARMRWEEMPTSGRKPSPRGYHTANLIGNVMVVVGGSDGKECFSDIWRLNLDTLVWTQVKLQIAHRRLAHSATQVGSYLFILGGHDGNEYRSDLLLLNLVSLQYESRPTAGKPPSPRGHHVSLLADSRIYLFGGYNGHNAFDDVHILDLAAAAYLPQVTTFTIGV